MPKEFSFVGVISFDEYVEANRNPIRRRIFWFRLLALLAGVLFLASGLAGQMQAALIILGAVLILYSTVLFPLIFRFRVKRLWARYPKIHEVIDTLVTEEGMGSLDDRKNRGHVNWSTYIGFRETKNLFLVKSSPLMGHILAKRLLQGGDVDGVRELLTRHLPPVP